MARSREIVPSMSCDPTPLQTRPLGGGPAYICQQSDGRHEHQAEVQLRKQNDGSISISTLGLSVWKASRSLDGGVVRFSSCVICGKTSLYQHVQNGNDEQRQPRRNNQPPITARANGA